MFEAIDAMWDKNVQGWWVQVSWVVLVALWLFHTVLRGIHVYVAWPSERNTRIVWVAISLVYLAYFIGQMLFTDQKNTVTFAVHLRNIESILLVSWLIYDVLRGIRGTSARRALRAERAQQARENPNE